MSNNIYFVHACQKENTALAVFSFCIAAANENCKFGDVGMREARARGALRRRRKPCRGRAGSTRSERFMVRRAVRILLCLRQACAVTFTAREAAVAFPPPHACICAGKQIGRKKFLYMTVSVKYYMVSCARRDNKDKIHGLCARCGRSSAKGQRDRRTYMMFVKKFVK